MIQAGQKGDIMSLFDNTQTNGVYSSDGVYHDAMSEVIPRRTFNMIMGGTLGYGILLNILMCKYCVQFALSLNPMILIIGYLILGFAGTQIARRSDNPVFSFLGYNMLVVPFGLVLSIVIKSYGGIDADVVTHAFVITLEITALMAVLAVLMPEFMEKLSGFLTISLLSLLVVYIIEALLGRASILVSYISAAIFSLYIGYDIHKAQSAPSTVDSAIDQALNVYLDVINLFMHILRISGSKKRR